MPSTKCSKSNLRKLRRDPKMSSLTPLMMPLFKSSDFEDSIKKTPIENIKTGAAGGLPKKSTV